METASDDVIISPVIDSARGRMQWPVKGDPGVTVVRQRVTGPPPDNPARMRAHPGREWLVVLSGTAILMLGHRRFRVETHQAAEFPTMLPHAMGAEGGPCDVLGIFDRDARRGHQRAAREAEGDDPDATLACPVRRRPHARPARQLPTFLPKPGGVACAGAGRPSVAA